MPSIIDHLTNRQRVENALLRGLALTHADANNVARSPEGSRELRRICNKWRVTETWRANKTNNGRHKVFQLPKEERERILAERGLAAKNAIA